MNNEPPSTEKLSVVSKSPENKPAIQRWARNFFTWMMWFLSILGTISRPFTLLRRLVAWLREMSDDS